jgi:D-alanyl-D-alanine carboxypeptidase
MTRLEIIRMQEKIGTVPDGFWGPKSIAAVQKHLRALMPKDSNWPSSSQAALSGFYGPPGDESRLVNIPVEGLGVYYEEKPVKTVRCHKRVADSLLRVLTAISKGRYRSILTEYAGCYNNRLMRGGMSPSLHARGAAIDIRPAQNGNHKHWPLAADMPFEVMEEFAREGWLSAGAFWSRDAMHFQATK